GVPGGGSTRSVTSAPAITPPRALETLPPTVTVWADAEAAINRTAAHVAARQRLLITHTPKREKAEKREKTRIRPEKRRKPTTRIWQTKCQGGHLAVSDGSVTLT